MQNAEIFELDPQENNLVNDGVVIINTDEDDRGLAVIRHELRTFVCEGEYAIGLSRILETYLKNFDKPRQPAAWVSGFFGSGKSHLVKMLGFLWEDFRFPDGQTARTIKVLPTSISDQLVELTKHQRKYQSLVVRGTLRGGTSQDVRYTFLQLLLKALKLPPQYHHFKFVAWAQKEGVYDELEQLLKQQGKSLRQEYENLYVSSVLAKAVLQIRPGFATTEAAVRDLFKTNFPKRDSLGLDELVYTVRDEILPLYFNGVMPCMLVILDEVQQYIGQDGRVTNEIQHLAEDLCDKFGGRLLLVGTGQNALAETPQLQPLQDRFTVRVTLSDTDVVTVTRKTVLAKKAPAINALRTKLDGILGEISRNLASTGFAYTPTDRDYLGADYPILPTTRRFWTRILQAIDTPGTAGQLRSQLRIVNESIRRVKDRPLGWVVPADFIFEQNHQQLLQTGKLLNETNNRIMELAARGNADSVLQSRVLRATFLVEQLPVDLPGGRLKADPNTLADLLLEDLTVPSDIFRERVKSAVQGLLDQKHVMLLADGEIKIQTQIGQQWQQAFAHHATKLQNANDGEVERIRQQHIRNYFDEKVRGLTIFHGQSRVKREFRIWDKLETPSTDTLLNIWLRDGWQENEATVLSDIRSARPETPLAYAWVKPQRDAEIRQLIIRFLAAERTLNTQGVPTTLEAEQAAQSMRTQMGLAKDALETEIQQVCREAMVSLASGGKVDTGDLTTNLREALNAVADRQFPEFKSKVDGPSLADWHTALRKAETGAPNALEQVGWKQDAKDHPVAQAILQYLGNKNISGRDIRQQFSRAPYGWPTDAIDAVLLTLLRAEVVSSTEAVPSQQKIPAANFRREVHTLTVPQKIQLRKLFAQAGLPGKPNEEVEESKAYLRHLLELAQQAGGEAPLLEPVSTVALRELEHLEGNARLLALLERREELNADMADWQHRAELARQRQPLWSRLRQLLDKAPDDATIDQIGEEVDAISRDRLLLHEPDLVAPLLERTTAHVRTALVNSLAAYQARWQELMDSLQADPVFAKLAPEQQSKVLAQFQLLVKLPQVPTDAAGLLNFLQDTPFDTWTSRRAALPQHFADARTEAARLTQPQARAYSVRRAMLNSHAELDDYLAELRLDLEEMLDKGQAIILE